MKAALTYLKWQSDIRCFGQDSSIILKPWAWFLSSDAIAVSDVHDAQALLQNS
jgi:hypothetical protein